MSDLIPLFQSLVWPIFILILLSIFRRPAGELFDLLKKRIESGSEFSVNLGQGGISIGEAPKMPVEEVEAGIGFESMPGMLSGDSQPADAEGDRRQALESSLHLVHAGILDDLLTRENGRPTYRIRVRVESDRPDLLARVSKVHYHLHPDIIDSSRTATNRSEQFEIYFSAWGQFYLKADLYIVGEDEPIRLGRYLNF